MTDRPTSRHPGRRREQPELVSAHLSVGIAGRLATFLPADQGTTLAGRDAAYRGYPAWAVITNSSDLAIHHVQVLAPNVTGTDSIYPAGRVEANTELLISCPCVEDRSRNGHALLIAFRDSRRRWWTRDQAGALVYHAGPWSPLRDRLEQA